MSAECSVYSHFPSTLLYNYLLAECDQQQPLNRVPSLSCTYIFYESVINGVAHLVTMAAT